MTSIDGIYPNRSWRNQSGTYQKIRQSVIYWTNKAQNLFDAADAAYKEAIESRVVGKAKSEWIDFVYKYLAGMAVENLLKAIMIGQDKSLVGEYELSQSTKWHDVWTRHKSDRLKFLHECESKSLQANERLTEDEKKFLSVVECYVVWVGRYPIPVTESAFRNDLDAIEDFEQAHPKLEDFDNLFQSAYGKLMWLAAKKERESIAKTKLT
jgi:hypothetical protein